jgi:hypothetical protein
VMVLSFVESPGCSLASVHDKTAVADTTAARIDMPIILFIPDYSAFR